MKKTLILFVLVAMAAVCYAATATDNPLGGLYPVHLRRAAKGTPMTFRLQTYMVIDTGLTGGKPARNVDTTGPKEFMFYAPFDCKVDSFYFTWGTKDTFFNHDTAATDANWKLRIISDTANGAGADTLRFDSTVTASFGSSTVKRPFGKWRPRGGPDSASNILNKGDYLMFQLKHTASCTSQAVLHGNFMVIPTDR